ncbi:cytochrome c-type biogenesis protein CcmE [Acidithrix ferrooxidans]|uniref:Cytochrome c-type biogenesis protein CcmE n=1 Tax=Acidithrix ferrooxidans TaxID=1280514 RepID=A0A0D8HF35_9ACTN|nr:cytochrome c-type biogenesis protein CcmE [Acidithrix ferrooxidans]
MKEGDRTPLTQDRERDRLSEQQEVSDLLNDRAIFEPPLPKRAKRRRALKIWSPFVVLALALGFLLVRGLGNALVYFRTVDETLSMEATLGTSTFRLEGVVVPQSVTTNNQGGVDFQVSGVDGRRISVIDSANPPQLFQANLPVVLVGYLSHGTFYSNQIMVKHSSSYIAAHPSRVASLGGKKL